MTVSAADPTLTPDVLHTAGLQAAPTLVHLPAGPCPRPCPCVEGPRMAPSPFSPVPSPAFLTSMPRFRQRLRARHVVPPLSPALPRAPFTAPPPAWPPRYRTSQALRTAPSRACAIEPSHRQPLADPRPAVNKPHSAPIARAGTDGIGGESGHGEAATDRGIGGPGSIKDDILVTCATPNVPTASLKEAPRRESETPASTQTPLPASNMVTLNFPGFPIFCIPARYLLYCVPFLWGTFGPAVRVLFSVDPHPGPSGFNTERLFVAISVYIPALMAELSGVWSRVGGSGTGVPLPAAETRPEDAPGPETYDDPWLSLKAGLELGAWVFAANVSQVVGLQSTSAGRAAFLVQLQTVLIPMLTGLFGLNEVPRTTWISSVVAVAGVALLSMDKGHGMQSSVGGDALEVLSALFFSGYVLRLAAYCNRIKPVSLVAVKLVVQVGLSSLWALGMEAWALAESSAHPVAHSADGPIAWSVGALVVNVAVIAWTGLMSSSLSGWMQSKAQQSVPASEAAVILATQPLWASATAAIVLGEAFGLNGYMGGALIILSTLIAARKDNVEGVK